MPTLTNERPAVLAVEEALIQKLPIGVGSVGLAVTLGAWLRGVDVGAADLTALATELRRLAPLD